MEFTEYSSGQETTSPYSSQDNASSALISCWGSTLNPLLSFDVLLTTVCLYLLVVMSLYCYRRMQQDNTPGSYAKNIWFMSIFGAVCLAVFIGWWTLAEVPSLSNLVSCDFARRFTYITLEFSYGSTYLILWLRQRMFYVDPRMRSCTSAPARFLSAAIVWALLVYQVFVFVFGMFFYNFKDAWFPMLVVLFTFSLHITTSWLLGYPLWKNMKTVAQLQENAAENRNTQRQLQCMKRLFLTSLYSIGLDGFSVLMWVLLDENAFIRKLVAKACAMSVFIATHMAFADWRKRLFPCVYSIDDEDD